MSGITYKITSLLVRTLAKPIANRIKAQAREHQSFRRVCVSFAQSLHRMDMRLRLGLLQDQAAIDRQMAREAAARKQKSEIPTVKTEAQAKADGGTAHDHEKTSDKAKHAAKPKIKPLSEAKAIETGANFISEGFLFSVGIGIILIEGFRQRRKEANRRSDVADRIADLEARDVAKEQQIEAMTKEMVELRSRSEWHWPWNRGPLPSGAKAAVANREADHGPDRLQSVDVPKDPSEAVETEAANKG